MAINFFEKEVRSAQQKFNQTFGMLTVCDLKLRQAAIVSICLMGNLSGKIEASKNKQEVRDKIKRFMRIRAALSNVFGEIENHLKERGAYGDSVDTTEGFSDRKSSTGG